MFSDLQPRDFCEIWVPKIYKIKPGTRGRGKPSYRQACIEFLCYILDESPQTVAYWIDYSPDNPRTKPNRYLLKCLRAADIQLKNLEQMPFFYQKFLDDLRKYSKILD